MPLLYRNVVPNVPAWTADNGKIVFRGNAPSHQRFMLVSVEWSGNLDLAEWKEFEDDDGPHDWLDVSMSAAEINAAFAANGGVGGDAYYNDTFAAPLMDNAYFACIKIGFSYEFTSGGIVTKSFHPDLYLAVGIDWDSTNQFWRWEARLYRFNMWFYYLNSAGSPEYHVCGFNSTTRAALYRSTQSTTGIRAGTGVTLDFVGRLPSGGSLPWVDSMLSGTSLIVSAQYAT